jgi:hypothetical protein
MHRHNFTFSFTNSTTKDWTVTWLCKVEPNSACFPSGGAETPAGPRRERGTRAGNAVQRFGRTPRSRRTASGATIRWRHGPNHWPGVGAEHSATAATTAAKRSTAGFPGRH